MNKTLEKAKINKAINNFAKEMKERMFYKVDQGKSGWDGDTPSNMDLIFQINGDMHEIAEREYKKQYSLESLFKDVANRCMMLWFRNENK